MKICVTKEDIKSGQKAIVLSRKLAEDTSFMLDIKQHCAIAQAFQRATGDLKATWFFYAGTTKGKRWRAKRRDYVQNWVACHDKLLKVKPFNFIAEYIGEVK